MACQHSLEHVTHLVTTGDDRFYSTGVDVGVVQSPTGEFLDLLAQLQQLLARLLTFPLVTVAAINGEGVAYIDSSLHNEIMFRVQWNLSNLDTVRTK